VNRERGRENRGRGGGRTEGEGEREQREGVWQYSNSQNSCVYTIETLYLSHN